MDSHICIMSSTKPYFICIVEVDDVKLLLTLVILLRGINLKRLNDDKILLRLTDIEYLMCLVSMSEVILELSFAQLTVKGFPSVSCHVRCNFLIFVTA